MAPEPFTMQRCVHYRDTTSRCRADVDPVPLTDEHGRLPCVVIRGITGTIRCDELKMPQGPIVGDKGLMARRLEAILAGRCPACDGPIHAEMEFNGAILAMPCRHVIRSARE